MTWEGLSPPYSTIVVDPPWPYEEGMSGWLEKGGKRRGAMPYSSMPREAITSMPVGQLAMPGAHLYLWTTQRFVWDAKEIAEAWGWRTLKLLTWCKEPMGVGHGGAFANTTEFVLFCRRPVGAMIRAARVEVGWSQDAVDLAVRGRVTRLAKRWEDDDCYPGDEDWAGLREALPSLRSLPDLASEPTQVNSTWWQWKRGPHSAKPPAFLDLVEQVSPAPRVELFARAQRLGWDSWGWGYEQATG